MEVLKQRHVEKRIGHSISQSSWSCEHCQVAPHLPHTLLLFFFSGRAGRGPADELTLPFGFVVVAVTISALRFALPFEGGGEGADNSSSFSSSSSSPESPPAPSSSPEDLSDEFVSVEESLDSVVFCANVVP